MSAGLIFVIFVVIERRYIKLFKKFKQHLVVIIVYKLVHFENQAMF